MQKFSDDNRLGIFVFSLSIYFTFSYLAIHNSNISPTGLFSLVWPSAGIAAVYTLVFGRVSAWGCGLGCLLSLLTKTSFMYALWPSIGAIVQALFSVYVYKLFLPFPQRYPVIKNLFKALLLIGPVGCLFNSSFTTIIYFTLDIISFENIFKEWIIFYLGDIIGVTSVFPIYVVLNKITYQREDMEKQMHKMRNELRNLRIFKEIVQSDNPKPKTKES